MTLSKKFSFLSLFLFFVIFLLGNNNKLLATWNHDKIIEELANRSSETIELYMSLKDDIKDPNQIASLLNLNSIDKQPQVQSLHASQNDWNHEKIRTILKDCSVEARKLYSNIKDDIKDPNQIASLLNLDSIDRQSQIQSSSQSQENSLENILKISRSERLKEINNESRNFDNVDVHQFNRFFVLKHKDFIFEIAKAEGLNPNYSFAKVVAELTARKSNQFKTTNSIHMLQQYFNRYHVDPETQLNVPNLFSYIWSACEKTINKGKLFKLHDGRELNSIDYFAWSLEENITTQGGCFPGFSGRFFRDLFTLMMMLQKD